MTVCLIYSGHIRTWEQCKGNHAERLIPAPAHVVHYNETTHDLTPYGREEWLHYYRGNEYAETESQPENTLSMWRGMWNAWHLAPPGFDCYVRNRYDIVFDRVINFDDYPMTPDRVYIPDCNDYRDGVNDQFAFGSYAAMEKYYSVFLHHKTHFDAGKPFHTESYHKYTLDMLGVKIVRIPAINTIIRG